MSNYKFSRIGCIPISDMPKSNPREKSTTLLSCVRTKPTNDSYIGTTAGIDSSESAPCYSINNKQNIPWNIKNNRDCIAAKDIPIYKIEGDSCSNLQSGATPEDIEACLDNGGKNYLDANIREKKDNINLLKNKIKEDHIKKLSLEQNIPIDKAQAIYDQDNKMYKARVVAKRVEGEVNQLREKYSTVEDSHIKSTDLISKTLAQFATKNQEQRDKSEKIQKLNTKVNTVAQDIYLNQKRYKDKEKVVSFLKTILIILIVLALGGIVYYGVKYTQKNYPDMYNNVSSKFNGLNMSY